jgi:hypothetical protein
MPVLIALAVFILLSLGITCFAAHRIKASKFEVTTTIWKLASLRITVVTGAEGSPEERGQAQLSPPSGNFQVHESS